MFLSEFNTIQLSQIHGKMPEIPVPDSKYISATVLLMDSNDVQFCLGTSFCFRRILTTATCVYEKSLAANFGGMYVISEANFFPENYVKHFVHKINCSTHYLNGNYRIKMQNDIAIVTVSTI